MAFASPKTGVAPRRILQIALIFFLLLAFTACGNGRTESLPVAPQPDQSIVLIDINSADTETLQNLPGIGPKTADRIVSYRRSFGPFRNKAELMLVEGIGEKQYLKLRFLVRTD